MEAHSCDSQDLAAEAEDQEFKASLGYVRLSKVKVEKKSEEAGEIAQWL